MMFNRLPEPEVISEAVNLMYALMQYGHDPDVAMREMSPINEMAFVAKEKPVEAELGRDGL